MRSASVTVGNDGTLYSVIDLSSGAGAVIALDPNGSLKWKYETVGAIPDGGVVLGEDGTVYANGGKASGSNGAGVVALGSDGSLNGIIKPNQMLRLFLLSIIAAIYISSQPMPLTIY